MSFISFPLSAWPVRQNLPQTKKGEVRLCKDWHATALSPAHVSQHVFVYWSYWVTLLRQRACSGFCLLLQSHRDGAAEVARWQAQT